MGEMFIKADPKKHETQKLVNIKMVVESLNIDTVKDILFMHPWTGCDATSATFNKGKTVLMKLLTKTDREVLYTCSTIDKVDTTSEAFGKAGVKLCIKTSALFCECFHGFFRIKSLTDRKLYYLFV